ncbi:T6SS immunity protein Tdi1 domain-containing protein [Nocardia sp. NPDC059240]|uniref:T6SS immunity protein Tdi1 domain-containing protein n=1 Tax=Nocardia sp. NPDC059240 TaxID=3346786 RepID=UPI003697416F
MATAAPQWAALFPQFDTVFGYSDLGHIFVVNQATGEHGLLYPYDNGGKNYGYFASTTEFVDTIIRDDYVTRVIFLSHHVAEIRQLLGPLGPDEVYIPVPYPFLGGTGEPGTYEIGNYWVFLDVLAGMMFGG